MDRHFGWAIGLGIGNARLAPPLAHLMHPSIENLSLMVIGIV